MISQKEIFKLVKSMVGSNDVVAVNMTLVRFAGSWPAGLMLSQLLYWSERSRIPGGWVCKTYQEWEDEILLSEYQVRVSSKHMERDMGIIETRVKKFDGTPKLQYRIMQEPFAGSFLKFLNGKETQGSNNSRVDPEETQGSLEPEETQGSITETTETLTETTLEDANAPLPEKEEAKPDPAVQQRKEKEKSCGKKEKDHDWKWWVDTYYQFYETKAGIKPILNKGDYSALRSIRKALAQQQGGEALAQSEFLYIFQNWAKLENYLQRKLKPTQINSELLNIQSQIRGKQQKVTGESQFERRASQAERVAEKLKLMREEEL